jgi:hypothetical protein
MRTWRKCLQQRRNIGKCLSSCHLNKHNLINSLRANLDERTFSSDDALKALPPKISPFLQEGQAAARADGWGREEYNLKSRNLIIKVEESRKFKVNYYFTHELMDAGEVLAINLDKNSRTPAGW